MDSSVISRAHGCARDDWNRHDWNLNLEDGRWMQPITNHARQRD